MTVIRNNMPAVNTLNTLNRNNNDLTKALQKVSSGLRINGAADDASGYAIAARLHALEGAYGQDIQNASNGLDLVKVASGGIQSVVDNLRSMKAMALDSANGHNSDADRDIIQKEFGTRMDTIADIAAETNYNGRLLLNGDYSEPVIVKSTVSQVIPLPPTAGKPSVVENELRDLTGAFSVLGSTSEFGSSYFYSIDDKCPKTYTTSSYSGKVEIKIDFSRAVVSSTGSRASYPDDYDGQGFAILCAGCPQYINIKFDASKGVSESSYNPKFSDSMEWSREYVIGIRDVTNEAGLEKAVFDGVKAAKTSWGGSLADVYSGGEWGMLGDFPRDYYKDAEVDTADSYCIDAEHNLRIAKNPEGSGYILQRDAGPNVGLYDLGTFEDGGGGDDDDSDRRRHYEDVTVLREGNPLIIHTGPKDNQYIPIYINSMHPIAIGINRAAVSPMKRAVEAIDIIDRAIDYVLNEMTRMGAYQQRLELTGENLTTAQENTINAKSTMADADMAQEMSNYTKANVLAQSAQSMLAQANQNVGGVLDLLQ